MAAVSIPQRSELGGGARMQEQGTEIAQVTYLHFAQAVAQSCVQVAPTAPRTLLLALREGLLVQLAALDQILWPEGKRHNGRGTQRLSSPRCAPGHHR